MKILIVEDSEQQYELIRQTILSQYPELELFIADNYDEAVRQISKNKFQIFILDIDLGEGVQKNGISLAKHIRSISGYTITPILFLTSIPTEVTSAINDTHCYSYLIKPYTEERLLSTLNSLMQSPLLPREPMEVKGINGIYFRVKPEDIIYLEIFKHNLIIYTKLNTFETQAYTITEICYKLSNYIIQIHKSFAVNPSHIISIDANYVHINYKENTVRLPIGRKYKNEVTRRL